MSSEVKWLIPQRVCYFWMAGNISRKEFRDINDAVAVYIKEGQAPIHLIVDISALKWLAMNVQWIAKTTAIRNKKVGYVLVIGANGFFVFTTDMVRSITKAKIH